MFNLQGGEIIIVLLLALVVLGPEKLPDAMRKAGRAYAELRKVATGFQDEFRKAVQEPVDEVKGSVRDTANLLRDSADFTKLSSGQRAEKPHSAEMQPADQAATEMPPVPLVAPPDPTVVPTDATPTFERSAVPADDPAGGKPVAPRAPAGESPPESPAEPVAEPVAESPAGSPAGTEAAADADAAARPEGDEPA